MRNQAGTQFEKNKTKIVVKEDSLFEGTENESPQNFPSYETLHDHVDDVD